MTLGNFFSPQCPKRVTESEDTSFQLNISWYMLQCDHCTQVHNILFGLYLCLYAIWVDELAWQTHTCMISTWGSETRGLACLGYVANNLLNRAMLVFTACPGSATHSLLLSRFGALMLCHGAAHLWCAPSSRQLRSYPAACSVTASFTLPQHRRRSEKGLSVFSLFCPVHASVIPHDGANVYRNVCGSRTESASVLVFYQFLLSVLRT